MLTTIMKWASITMLLLAGLGPFSGNSELVFEIVLCAGVIPVVLGSMRGERPRWAIGLIAIAMVFNLIGPVKPSQAMILWLDLTCIAAFIVSLAVLQRQPAFSMASTTDRTLGEPFRIAGADPA